MKVLVATEKPFAKAAVDGIRGIVEGAGHTLALLEKYTKVEDLYAAVSDANALIVRSDKVTREVINSAKNLKIVVRAGAGFDNLDLPACTERGIVAMNTPGQNSNAVAELAIGMMIYASRNCFTPGTGVELKGKTLGIHAFGNVGRLVAKLGQGFGMNIVAFDPFVSAEAIRNAGATPVNSIEELYEKSNYLSLHIPATNETKKSVGYELMKRMPKGAVLINTARKEVINEEELVKILEERVDIKYITDIAADIQATLNEKFGVRVFASPKKMGAETAEANINAGLAAANQIIKFFATGDKTFQLNK
ncbi:MAG: NAD(P)-dependent oxidoreductase [Bacteroidales bacterium]|nr:NAD(P)-dependent oxidoreductase [Bacteroidales bacterium]